MEFHELLERIGVDAPATVARLGGMESILRRFILKFPQDPTFSALTANLGIEPLRQLSAEYLEQIRTAVPPSELTTYQRQLTQEYRRVTQSITQFLAEQTG